MNARSICEPKRLLLVRLDRIGDLVLTLPVDESFPETKVDWWIPQGLSFVTSAANPARNAKEVPRKIGIKAFFDLLGKVRRENYDAAVVFHAPWWVSVLLWLARIPLRGGVKSQWHSFLFLNRAIRQKRSRAEYSELEYNYRLIESIFKVADGTLHRTHLHLKNPLGNEQTTLLESFDLKAGAYSIVHPGMGGSALNWPITSYADLVRRIAKNETVVITGTKSDEPYIAPLRDALAETLNVVWLDGKLSGPELIAVLAAARTITAPSTGVLHLAASTGQPTLGIFSPVRVQHPRRWGPQGPNTQVILPEESRVSCPGELSCQGKECPHYNCMAAISVDSVSGKLEVKDPV